MLNIQSISKTFNPGTVNAKQALSGCPCIWITAIS